jgi:Phage P22-like portal protein
MPADVSEAIDFLRIASDAETENRDQAVEDLRFRYGDQWPSYAITSRGLQRPQLTVNEMDSYIRQVTNSQRQQRPRGKCQPVDDFADVQIAKVITGTMRHVEEISDASHAYDTAFDWAATIGWGYWRMRTDYIAPNSFNQDIFIDVVDNPFTVYIDPNSNLPDGSDMEKALITDMVSKETFKEMHPGAEVNGFSERGTGDGETDWFTQHDIRLAEYFWLQREDAKLVMLSDGSTLWADQLPENYLLARAGIEIKATRSSLRNAVKWRKQSGADILEEKDIEGRWIPIIPVYWTSVIIDGKRIRQGMVRPAKDAQRIVNFTETSIIELLAMAPKAKWLAPERAVEGHENEFQAANISPFPLLTYRDVDDNGEPIQAPARLQPEPPPAGWMEARVLASQNLQKVMGMFDPAVRAQEPKSGRAIRAEQGQSEMSNSHGYDNLTRSIKHTWRIGLSWFPSIYDTQRVQRIIGEDGRPALVTLNEKRPESGSEADAIGKVLNDVTVGQYDVVMEVGPGYETKRAEGVDSMMQLLGTPLGEEVAKVGADLIIREMDFAGADVLADRMAAMNPVAQIDETSEIPPEVQMQIKALQMQLQKAQQVIQTQGMDLKYRGSIEKMRQDGQTQRTHMQEIGHAHDVEMRDATRQHDSMVDAMSKQGVEETKGIVQLLLAHIDTAQLEREIESREQSEIRAAEQPAAGANGASKANGAAA